MVKDLKETIGDSGASYDNITETLAKMKSKIASAQRKMNMSFGANKGVSVSTFEPAAAVASEKIITFVKKQQHNSD